MTAQEERRKEEVSESDWLEGGAERRERQMERCRHCDMRPVAQVASHRLCTQSSVEQQIKMGMTKVQLNCKAADQRRILSVYRYLLHMLGRCACVCVCECRVLP